MRQSREELSNNTRTRAQKEKDEQILEKAKHQERHKRDLGARYKRRDQRTFVLHK